MLEIDVLKENKGIFNPNTSELENFPKNGIWDLTRSSLNPGNNITIKSAQIVTDDQEMRADLITNNRYSSPGSMGSLLKINGVSNPFSVQSGDVLYIPNEDSISKSIEDKKTRDKQNSNTNTNPNRTFRKAQEAKKFSPSSERSKYLDSIKNKTPESLPPNMLQPGESPVVTKSGLIFFGPDATSQNS